MCIYIYVHTGIHIHLHIHMCVCKIIYMYIHVSLFMFAWQARGTPASQSQRQCSADPALQKSLSFPCKAGLGLMSDLQGRCRLCMRFFSKYGLGACIAVFFDGTSVYMVLPKNTADIV